jgi:hypothetical protein
MFEDQFTGIQVFRQIETGSPGDDYTSQSITKMIVFTGFCLVDIIKSSSKQDIIDNFGQQVAQGYIVYFDLNIPIQNGDYVVFNTNNINQNIAYTPGVDTVLRIENFNTGSGNIGALEAKCLAN